MDSRWHLLEPRDRDPPNVLSAKLLHLERLIKISESRLNELKEQPQTLVGASPVEQQQPADEANAILQHVIGTADSAESPFRIKRKDAHPKKGALGFRPLLRSSSKPSQSVKSVAPARSAAPSPELSDLPTNEPKAGRLPEERQLSPSAFRTPAITRSLPQLGAQLSSDVPTEKAAGTALPTSMPEPAQNPRPWGRLQLQQQDTKAALSAQHLQQQPDSVQQAQTVSPPLQELSNNSSCWLAPERPRGFQGKLRLRKNKSGTGALKRGFPAPASGHQALQAPSEAASAPAQNAQHTAQDDRPGEDADLAYEGITAAASPSTMPGDRAHTAVEDAQDLVDVTPEQPQWRSKQSSRLLQLAESAPIRRPAGSGRLPLVQQLLTHPTLPSTLQQDQKTADLLQHSPQWHAGDLGLSLEAPLGQHKSSSSISDSKKHIASHSSGSLQQPRADGCIPETCAQPGEAIPDTPDCRTSKQSSSTHSAVLEAPLTSLHLQQESLAEHQGQALHGNSDPVHGTEHCTEKAAMRAECAVGAAYNVKDGRCRRDTTAASDGGNGRANHGSRYYFSKPIVFASACSSGRCMAVCLMEQGSASCSVQVWSMQEQGQALGALLLAGKGALKAGNAAPQKLQQLLAVSSIGDTVMLASSAALEVEEGRSSCVSLLFKAEGSLQHETLMLPTQQETTCVFLSPAGQLFAAGQGGHVHCWSLGDGPSQPAPPCQQLPAASFGGIKFPDIQCLGSAGEDCILGCSSIGSVALWNFARGELLMARQEAGHLLHSLQCLPSAWLPQLVAQPPGKRPVAALALAQRRSSGLGAGQQQRLALALMWPEQIAVSVLSEGEAVTHFAIAGMYAGLALASGAVRLVDLQKGTQHMEYGGMRGIRGLAAAGLGGIMVFFHDSIVLLDCFNEKLSPEQERSG